MQELPDRIVHAVEASLAEAPQWLAWDGRPRASECSVWTPNKAMRRVTDHLIDHLAQTEAAISGEGSLEDTWRGRWDADRGEAWTIRRMGEHCADSLIWYAAQPLGRDVPMPD